MRKIFVTLAALSVSLMFLFGAEATPLQQRLRAHVDTLCSEELAGRKAGSREGRRAGDYVAEIFGEVGLVAWKGAELQHPFEVPFPKREFCNIVGCIEGSAKDSYIVVGAHYDHLGTNRKGKVFWGADDNASGVAVLLEVARELTRSEYKPSHTIVFAAFDAEELGLFGSRDLAELFPEGGVKAMINMDMVGRLDEGSLDIEGTGTLAGSREVVLSLGNKYGIKSAPKEFESKLLLGTDTDAFAKSGCATLSLTTGLHKDYHKPSDTAEKIDFEGLERITLFAGELVRSIDSNREIVPTGKVARKHRTGVNTLSAGVSFAFGSNRYHFSDGGYEGVDAGAWNIGGTLQYTFKYIGIRTGVGYERLKAMVPSRKDDLHSKAQTITHDYLTIPLDVVLKTEGVTCGYVAVGGYFSVALGSHIGSERLNHTTIDKTPCEWGWQWSLGGRIGDLTIEATNRYALSAVYTSQATTLNHTALCTLGWYF